ncbi:MULTISPECIES: 4-aminobutyrate--2-oxoglutarate transaminase [unclassified Azospirillum]|uniref:4-aminobutyrate--2-oxoglutarate transaminase n=1 Tax=unclassified Azospirillum TaxID=2630922 RepID=UPI000B6CF92E|nr:MULTISPECIES: 4-aminobutyrate--2-oxoglutarate transaminase [unclassified Azospirillum]SNS47994.1 4-aminobutyrate aminotransferase / (S)-3-amino-2-methylpropionate transaminase [Azospirillum sp. RU38E]SNS67152.1 4-aminobutyrate aminotransferase / (S)-3-amino-2-methylpropionate transaminase [Azospirillum sp. RU37A]
MPTPTASNADLLRRRSAAVPRGVATAFPIYADRAENAELWDVEGNRFVDFAGGIAVLNTGHRHPKVMAAVAAQAERFTHTAFQVAAYDSYIALAEALNARAPFKAPAKSILFTTGAEAVENAVKIARCATGRNGVITFSGAFHGRTLMTMAMTGKVLPYKRGFGSMPAEVYHLPFPVPQNGVTVADSLKALDFLFAADIGPDRVAAIVIEPVQGEGGFHPAPVELLKALREICDRHGILLIADEVQSGFARTGRLFAIEHSGVEPDLITMAKSLAGGFPLSGVLGKAEIMDRVEPGGLGGTYAGSPLACAAALAVLSVIEEEGLCARADAIGETIKARLETFATRNDLVPITAIRGLGAMIGFDIVTDRTGGAPDKETTARVTAKALAEGLILLSCGTHGNVIRILVPLTVGDAVLAEGLAKLERALTL